jgi:general secretion pathway protein F
LIASGERSGELSAMLKHVAHLQDKEVEERTLIFTKLLEPLLILGMGIMVLMIILSIMLPIFELNQIIR